jgi:hypothetical protein
MSETQGVTFNMTLTLPQPASVFGITIHGVQPLFLIRDLLHVPDRNILTRICAKNPSDADKYWIPQLNSTEITFNPIFTAAEGSSRREPTRLEFIEAYFLAENKIREHLPLVAFVPHSEATLSQSYALIEDIADRRRRESEFLISVAPLVTVRSPDEKLPAKAQEILRRAVDHGLGGGSLSLLAVLSCLYESSTDTLASPGRGVLHPKMTYTSEDAHNCLSDLLALELLVASSSLGIGRNALITADKNLGRFWQALGASATQPINGRGTGRFQITSKLLHRIDDDGLARLERLFSSCKV